MRSILDKFNKHCLIHSSCQVPSWTCSQFWCKHHNPGSVGRCGKCGADKAGEELDREGGGDYVKGRCVRENCKYAHVRPPTKEMSDEPCSDFQKSRCSRSNCRFRHVLKDDDKSKQVCHDFQNGEPLVNTFL